MFQITFNKVELNAVKPTFIRGIDLNCVVASVKSGQQRQTRNRVAVVKIMGGCMNRVFLNQAVIQH